MAHDILLEVGTNEAEFLEFYLNGQPFAINVAKVKQLIRFEPEKVTEIPESYPSVVGSLHHLEHNIPIVDLHIHLKRKPYEGEEPQIIIITDFNQTLTGFIVDGVNKIHRLSWDSLQPVSGALIHRNPKITGAIVLDGRQIMILDFEYILDDINPRGSFSSLEEEVENESDDDYKPPGQDAVPIPKGAELASLRAHAKVYLADDSMLFRAGIVETLKKAGYARIKAYENGQVLLQSVNALAREAKELNVSFSDLIDIVVTDIEMPRLDGLTLCKQLKTRWPGLPVIVLSSLITEQMGIKCDSVGADSYFSKKQMDRLLQSMDALIHHRKQIK